MNPKRLERIDDHRDKEWKLPLPEYIQSLYQKRFGKEQPDSDLSVEERVRQKEAKKSAKRQNKRSNRPSKPSSSSGSSSKAKG